MALYSINSDWENAVVVMKSDAIQRQWKVFLYFEILDL